MKKYLVILVYIDAGFLSENKSKFFACDGKVIQKTYKSIKDDCLPLHCIENCLRVLFGCRPIRYAGYDEDEFEQPLYAEYVLQNPDKESFIRELARNCDVTVENIPVNESLALRKAKHNSWNNENNTICMSWDSSYKVKGPIPTWSLVKMAYPDHIGKLIDIAEQRWNVSNIESVYTFKEFLEKLSYDNWKEKERFINSNIPKPIVHMLCESKHGITGFNQKMKLMTVSGYTNIKKIHGSIKFDLDEEQYSRLMDGPGCATILDGGLVLIDAVHNRF